jgi:hypothetical protein
MDHFPSGAPTGLGFMSLLSALNKRLKPIEVLVEADGLTAKPI